MFLAVAYFTLFFCPTAGRLNLSLQRVVPDEAPLSHEPLAEAMLYMTKTYLATHTSTLVVTEACEDCSEEQRDFHKLLLQSFLSSVEDSMTLQLFVGRADKEPWDYNLVIVNSAKAFEKHRPAYTDQREFRFFIVLTADPAFGNECFAQMNEIARICRQSHVINAVIMKASTQRDTFHLYKYVQFDKQCTASVSLRKINTYRRGHLEKDFLFPLARLQNFNNCPINVSACVLHPFLMFHGDTKNPSQRSDIWRLGGIDGDILRILADALKFRVNLKFSQLSGLVGSTGDIGIFEKLNSGWASIGIGGLSSAMRNNSTFSFSVAYHQTPLIFVVRSSTRLGPLSRLAEPFSNSVWRCIILTMFAYKLLLLAVRRIGRSIALSFGGENKNCLTLLDTYAIFLGTSVSFRKIYRGLALAALLLGSSFLRNVYQAKVFDTLRTSKRVPIPRDLAGLIHHKYVLITSSYKDFYPTNQTCIYKGILERFLKMEKPSSKRLTALALLDTLCYYNRQNSQDSRLTYVRSPLFQFQSVMFFSRQSMLQASIEHKLQQMIDSGFGEHVARRYIDPKFCDLNKGDRHWPLITHEMLTGLYYMLAALFTFAFLVFLLEVATKKSKKLKRLLDCAQ